MWVCHLFFFILLLTRGNHLESVGKPEKSFWYVFCLNILLTRRHNTRKLDHCCILDSKLLSLRQLTTCLKLSNLFLKQGLSIKRLSPVRISYHLWNRPTFHKILDVLNGIGFEVRCLSWRWNSSQQTCHPIVSTKKMYRCKPSI